MVYAQSATAGNQSDHVNSPFCFIMCHFFDCLLRTFLGLRIVGAFLCSDNAALILCISQITLWESLDGAQAPETPEADVSHADR